MPVIPVAGFSPAGLFVAQTFAVPGAPPGILAAAIDPVTHEYQSISRGMDPIDSQVIVALTRVKGSGAAVTNDGQTFRDVKYTDETAQALIDSLTRTALKRLTDRGDIAIVKIATSADPATDYGWTFVQYRNLRTKGPQARTLKISPL